MQGPYFSYKEYICKVSLYSVITSFLLPFLEGLEGLTNGNSIVFVKETICLPSFSLVIRFLEFRVWTVSVDFA